MRWVVVLCASAALILGAGGEGSDPSEGGDQAVTSGDDRGDGAESQQDQGAAAVRQSGSTGRAGSGRQGEGDPQAMAAGGGGGKVSGWFGIGMGIAGFINALIMLGLARLFHVIGDLSDATRALAKSQGVELSTDEKAGQGLQTMSGLLARFSYGMMAVSVAGTLAGVYGILI